MKKFLLSVIALFAATTMVCAQSLSLVIQDNKTKDDIAAINPGETYDAGSLWNGMMDDFIDFYVINQSDKSGTVNFDSWELVGGETPFPGIGICTDKLGTCLPELTGYSFAIKAKEVYKDNMHFVFFGSGDLKYKITISFSEDAEPCVFYFKVQLGNPSSINSINSNENNVKFYQNGSNVTMDYAFNEGGNRTLSIVSLSGNILYTCELEGSNGTLNVPVELAAGVYLYTVNGENGTTAHKFVVR